jgi:hypothetical protein
VGPDRRSRAESAGTPGYRGALEEAEEEARLRTKDPLAEPDPDYLDYLREHRGEHFVLALAGVALSGLEKPGEERLMEEETQMAIGRKTYKMIGHFPPPRPTRFCAWFPREAQPQDKSVTFRLCLPGLPFPNREIEFRVKDLMYRGKLAM